MKILNLEQGSPEWLEARSKYHTASEAPIMMGVSPHATRNELLQAKYNGSEKEVNDFVQKKVFDKGHQVEAEVRTAIEAELGQDLYPCMVVDGDGYLSASLDGMTLNRNVIWEHKQFNQEKVDFVEAHQFVPDVDIWQVQQQLLVTGAKKCLYTVGNDPENLASAWVLPDPETFDKIRAAWRQFDQDLENYEPPEHTPEAVGHTKESLPALLVEVTGMVTNSNLAKYKEHALAVFGSIGTDLQTDQDFADAAETVKWCKDVEDRLEAAKQHALSQTESIDELFRTIDDLKESAKQKRLELNKLVQARKVAIRDEIRGAGEKALSDHMQALDTRLEGRVRVPQPNADFGAAMKGKRTISSLRDAVDQVLANAKIESSAIADSIQANLRVFDELAIEYPSLFPDLRQLALKAPEDFTAAVKLRIAEHKEAEEKRLEEQRRIEEEREAREAEAAAAAEAETPEPTPPVSEPPPPAATPAPVHEQPALSRRSWLVTATFDITAFEQMGAEEVAAQFHTKATQLGLSPVLDSVTAEAVTAAEGKQEAA